MSQGKVPVGFTTHAGLLSAVGLFVGAVAAAIQNKSTESIVAALSATAVLLTTLGGRYAQAVVLARRVLTPPSVVTSTRSASGDYRSAVKKAYQDPEGPGDNISPIIAGLEVTADPPKDKGTAIPKGA